MLKGFKRAVNWKKYWREVRRRMVKKSVLHHRPSSLTVDCLSKELMPVESRPAHREEELPRPD
jgi:hypothetical protein